MRGERIDQYGNYPITHTRTITTVLAIACKPINTRRRYLLFDHKYEEKE